MVHGKVLAVHMANWAVTQTPSRGKMVKTKKHAQRLLTLWKRHKQLKGWSVVGSVGAGYMLASEDGLTSTEAIIMKQLPKGFTLEVDDG